MEEFNKQIEINLDLIFSSEKKVIDIFQLVDSNGKKILQAVKCNLLAEKLQEKKLIDLKGEMCFLSEFGYQVHEQGGWIKYKEESEKYKKEELRRIADFEAVELEHMQVSIEVQKKVLEDYPRTKWTAIASLLIAIIAAIISIWQALQK